MAAAHGEPGPVSLLRRAGIFGSRAEPVARAPSAPPVVVEPSPLLDDLITVASKQRCVVRDLAQATPYSVALFQRLSCRAQVGAWPAGMPDLLAAKDRAAFDAKLAQLLPLDSGYPATHIFCWSFLDYLPLGGISALMARIVEVSQPGGKVHALLSYSSPEMPSWPARFTPGEATGIRYAPTSDKTRAAPRYTPKDLLRAMPGFEIEKAMVLRSGFQEYVFRISAPKDPA